MSNILIIDDEKSIRKTLSEILSYEGYKIDEAGDGEEGEPRCRVCRSRRLVSLVAARLHDGDVHATAAHVLNSNFGEP